jgi:hypothetical protein
VINLPAHSYGTQNYEEFSEYKSKYRILYGILLTVGGGFLAYDGFRSVKVDMSKPSANINLQSRWNTMLSGNTLCLQARGVIANTGNVVLHNITFEIRYQSVYPNGTLSNGYYPAQYADGRKIGDPVKFDLAGSTILDTLDIDNTLGWSVKREDYTRKETGGNDPAGVGGRDNDPDGADNWYPGPSTDPNAHYAEVVNLKYTWDKKYKTQMNNAFEGVAGALLLGAGMYILIDYIVSLNKFEFYMKKHKMDVYVQNAPDEFWLMFSKRM